MRRAFLVSAVLTGGLFVAACSDNRSPLPTEPSVKPDFTVSATCPRPLELAVLIVALFPPNELLTFAARMHSDINLKMSTGDRAGAQKVVLALIDFTVKTYYQGKLRDPNGTTPPGTDFFTVKLIDGLLCWVGLPPSGLVLGPPNAASSPVTTKVIGPGGGDLQATDAAGNGYAALRVPAGTVSADRLWVITRRDGLAPQSCVTTDMEQVGLCIDFSVVPAQDLLKPVTTLICQTNDNAGLQLAHQLAGGKVELLAFAADPFGLPCPHSFSPAPPRGLGSIGRAVWRFGSFVARVLGPSPAYAGHSGLGGLVAPKLSNITAVQPVLGFVVQPTSTVRSAVITPAVKVAFLKFGTEGEPDTAVTNPIRIAIRHDPSETATLSGTLTRNPISGVSTFNDLSIDNTGTGYTLEANALSPVATGSVPLGISATSNTFDIQAPVLFRSTFTNDALDAPPGAPDVGSWSLTSPAGTILVRASSGNLTSKPVELDHSLEGVAGSVKLRGTVAGTPPGTGRYVARWRSLVHSANACFNGIVLRSASNLILASVEYRPNGQVTYNSNRTGGPIAVGSWVQNVAQLFEITVDLDNHSTSLSIDGTPIAAAQGQPYPDPTGTATNLAQINMELGCTAPPQQTYAWDDIEIVAAP